MARRDHREPPDLTKRVRINGRPQSDPATQAGLRNIHRDTRGRVISAMTPEGKRITQNGSDVNEDPTKTQPATGNLLAARKDLFSRMQQAGPNGVTPDLWDEASNLGVTPSGFRKAYQQLGKGSVAPASATPSAANPAPATARKPAYAQPPLTATQVGTQPFKPGQDAPGLTSQAASNTPGSPIPKSLSPTGQSINRLTGKPFGYTPGDSSAPSAAPTPSPLMAAALSARDVSRSMGDMKAKSDWRTATAPASETASVTPDSTPTNPISGKPVVKAAPKVTTPDFSVPSVPNPVSVGQAPAVATTPSKTGLSASSAVRTPSTPSARFTPPSRSYNKLVSEEGYTPLQAQKLAGKQPAPKATPTIGSSTIPKIPTSTIADKDSLLNKGIRFLNR